MLNDISFERPKKSGAKVFWAVFVTVIIMAGAGYVSYYYINMTYQNSLKSMQIQVDQLNKQIEDQKKLNEAGTATGTSATGSSTSGLVYNDSTYGFSLTFTNKWTGWKVKKAKNEGITASYYVEVPTTDSSWGSGETNDAGYASIFAISVWTKAEWAQTLEDPIQAETKITENDDYVFSWSHAQAAPDDIVAKGLFTDAKSIIATFKLN